jgi:acetyl esterase/lipase
LLYLHGGGHVAMSAKTHRAITGGFARRGFRVVAPDYRLAPEHVFPAALDDVIAVWRALREEVDGPIFLAGDSSGGGLCLALLLALRERGEEGPAAACLFSPWTDLATTGESLEKNRERDPMQSVACMRMLAAAYAGGADLRTPLISPLYGDLTGLPPLAIFVGDTEILLDDSRRLAQRARAVGVSAELHIRANAPHAWPLLSAIMPEGAAALDEATAFLLEAAPRFLTEWLRRRSPASCPAEPTKVRVSR